MLNVSWINHFACAEGFLETRIRRTAAYLLLLILHRRPIEEHAALISILNRYTEEMEVDTMAHAIAETLLEPGRTGLNRGLNKGKRAKRDSVLKLLQFRFGNVPETVMTQVNAIRSHSQLDSLFEKVLEAETIDDIF